MKRKDNKEIDGIEHKYCSKCDTWKPLTDFNNDKTRWDGYIATCRICHQKYMKEYREKNKEHLREHRIEYYKKYREKNREHLRAYWKVYFEENKEIMVERQKKYYQKNRDKRLEYQKEYDKRKKKNEND